MLWIQWISAHNLAAYTLYIALYLCQGLWEWGLLWTPTSVINTFELVLPLVYKPQDVAIGVIPMEIRAYKKNSSPEVRRMDAHCCLWQFGERSHQMSFYLSILSLSFNPFIVVHVQLHQSERIDFLPEVATSRNGWNRKKKMVSKHMLSWR